MRNSIIIIIALFSMSLGQSQEILAEVKVDYSQVQQSGTSTYQAMEKSLKDFINTTQWTGRSLKIHERIEANFSIIIQEKLGSNKYKASILVQSRRPVYNSNYYTPLLNVNDTKFTFEYQDYQQLIFNPRQFSGKNLTDVVAYYAYLVLGYDADSFSRKGGTEYFKTAQTIASNSQNTNYDGWSESKGPRNRTSLVNDILKQSNNKLRDIYYTYSIQGLDRMARSEVNAKNGIGRVLLGLEYYKKNNDYAQNYPLDLFFSAKKDEISKIFSGGESTTFGVAKLRTLLDAISPSNTDLWSKLDK